MVTSGIRGLVHSSTELALQYMDGGRKKKKEKKRKSNISWTNLLNKGLTSADRSNKATLLLTVPRSIQVVCKGFTPAYI